VLGGRRGGVKVQNKLTVTNVARSAEASGKGRGRGRGRGRASASASAIESRSRMKQHMASAAAVLKRVLKVLVRTRHKEVAQGRACNSKSSTGVGVRNCRNSCSVDARRSKHAADADVARQPAASAEHVAVLSMRSVRAYAHRGGSHCRSACGSAE
jgi:hypothetical protein